MTPAAQLRRNSVAASSASDTRAIPFDYAFRYTLIGKPNNVLNSIVTVSIEATFTAVSIGYGVVPPVDQIIFGPQLESLEAGEGARTRTLNNVTLGEILNGLAPKLTGTSTLLRNESGPEAVLKNGIKLNPELAELLLAGRNNQFPVENVPGRGLRIREDLIGRLFQVVASPSDLIQFKYAIFDEGSGREFQSEPILNIAGLGSANGERPFRHFAHPIVFRPRSTIRMEITEVSDFKGDLHVALHGFKMLGGQNSPTAVRQNASRISRRR